MKYQVGEKVKYDSDDWRFYGKITAVIENAICPCYRIQVERMEKKNCKFSITQFEFELELDNDLDSSKDKNSWEKYEDEYFRKNNSIPLVVNTSNLKPDTVPVSELVTPALDPDQASVQEHVRRKRQKKTAEPSQQIIDATQAPNNDMPANKRYGSWETNFDLYSKGHKSKSINTWMYQNRKQYQAGTLKKHQLEKLMQINFPFEAAKKNATKKSKAEKVAVEQKPAESNDMWHKQLRQWKYNDNRTSLQQWRQQNVKRYVEGRLSQDKIEKLKEVGILK